MRRPAAPIAALLLALACLVSAVQAAPLDDARALLRKGQYEQALEQVDLHLKSKPDDIQGYFLKGIILTEQGERDAAIKVFRNLTQRYPEVPEPYNNLAVLYAQRGDYVAARDALEMAVRVRPTYATAHENLGDVYAVLATQSYDKAVELDKDKTNAGVRTKLGLAHDLSGWSTATPTAQAARPAAAKTTAKKAAPAARPAKAEAGSQSLPAFTVSPELLMPTKKPATTPDTAAPSGDETTRTP